MKVEETSIQGLLVIQPKVFPDDRGYFFESYNQKKLSEAGFNERFVQDNLSKSKANVLRGLHFQKPPFAQGKLVQVIKGAVLDVAVDIREGSPTYGEHFSIELSEENKTQFYLPPGFAHGFLTLEDDTIFSYKCTDFYNKASEGSIAWDDPTLNIDWKTDSPLVSGKDMEGQSFEEFETPFKMK